jgi:hypothetical protein
MSNPASLIARLAAEGVSPELLGEVAMALATAQAAAQAIERRRATDRERQAKRRESHVMSRDVTGQTVTPRTAPNDPSPCPPHTPPITPTPNTHSDPVGPGSPSAEPTAAAEPADPRRELFGRGKQTVRKLTGRAMDGCGSLIGKWLKITNDDAVIVLAVIDDAVARELANPIPWIEQTLRAETQRNGTGSRDLFRQSSPSRGGRGGSSFDVVATGLARVADQRGLRPGGRQNGGGQDHRPDYEAGRDDPEIEDADWRPAGGYRAAYQ